MMNVNICSSRYLNSKNVICEVLEVIVVLSTLKSFISLIAGVVLHFHHQIFK